MTFKSIEKLQMKKEQNKPFKFWRNFLIVFGIIFIIGFLSGSVFETKIALKYGFFFSFVSHMIYSGIIALIVLLA